MRKQSLSSGGKCPTKQTNSHTNAPQDEDSLIVNNIGQQVSEFINLN